MNKNKKMMNKQPHLPLLTDHLAAVEPSGFAGCGFLMKGYAGRG
jgi:hypothetical protein